MALVCATRAQPVYIHIYTACGTAQLEKEESNQAFKDEAIHSDELIARFP